MEYKSVELLHKIRRGGPMWFAGHPNYKAFRAALHDLARERSPKWPLPTSWGHNSAEDCDWLVRIAHVEDERLLGLIALLFDDIVQQIPK